MKTVAKIICSGEMEQRKIKPDVFRAWTVVQVK